MFRRWARSKAAKVEARRWLSVSQLLEPEERAVEYIDVVAASRGPGLGSIVWLTDRRMIWTVVAMDGHSQLYDHDLPLAAIETVDLADDGRSVVVFYKVPLAGQRRMAFRPTPQSRALVLMFIYSCLQSLDR